MSSEPLLALEHLRKRFGGNTALSDVSLHHRAGEVLGLVGQNGSGKTTALNIISGFLRPTAGEVWFKGKRVDGSPIKRLVDLGIVRTFQQAMTFPSLTVRENFAIAAGGAPVAELMSRLRLDAHAGAPASALPHGLQRLLGVALAVARRPTLLLLDEPAAGLTQDEVRDLAAFIRDLRDAGISTLVVDHNMSFILPLVDRVVVLNAGEVIFSGTTAAMRADPGVIDMYLGAQPDATPDDEPEAGDRSGPRS